VAVLGAADPVVVVESAAGGFDVPPHPAPPKAPTNAQTNTHRFDITEA
jgi:hypothetical protein